MTSKDDWDDHWQRFGQSSELGPTPKYRHRIVCDLLKIKNRGSSWMLDIGCGMGDLAEHVSKLNPLIYYFGIDTSHEAIVIAKGRRIHGASFLRVNSDMLPPGEFADIAVCCEVVEHLDDPVSFLSRHSVMMKPGCKFVVTCPGGPMNKFYETIGHRRHYSPEELRQILISAGYEVWGYWGYGFPFFNLFRIMLSIAGDGVARISEGNPSIPVTIATKIFDVLFRMNLSSYGWQSVVLAVKKSY